MGAEPEGGEVRADVVVAEDDAFVAELIAVTLATRGMRVVVAADGEMALRMVERYRPRVLLLDIHMPRRSGLEVLRALRRDPRWRNLAIVVLTALGRREMEDEVLAEGADAFMQKPFDPLELGTLVGRLTRDGRDAKALGA